MNRFSGRMLIPRRSGGFSLIELMVVIVLLGIGLVGVSAMFVSGVISDTKAERIARATEPAHSPPAGVVSAPAPAVTSAEADLHALFEQKYRAWRDYVKQHGIGDSSIFTPYVANRAFQEIVALGVPALPFIMEKVDEGGPYKNLFMAYAAGMILKRQNWKAGERIWSWWKTGRLDIPKEFDAYFADWQAAQAQGDAAKAAAALAKIEGIGVLALPLLMDKAAAGHSALIPAISRLTDGAVKADTTKEQVGAWWAKDKAKWTLPKEKPAPASPAPPPAQPPAPPSAK